MVLSDVWRNISAEIDVYAKGRFDLVPACPGVYAWFYPLRLTTKDLSSFVDDINKVYLFDALKDGPPRDHLKSVYAWEYIAVDLQRLSKKYAPAPLVESTWERAVQDEDQFNRLRRCLMRASILMPPLYVGKTKNLNVRCNQHINGRSSSQFHDRFENYAASIHATCNKVSDLLFVCVKTVDDERKVSAAEQPLEDLIEEIMKRIGKPPYSLY